MDASSRAIWRKSSLLPSILCSHCIAIDSFRWITKRTVRMSSPSPSASQSASTDVNSSSAIDFLSLCHRLKTTKRAGWVKKGVQEPESVADHMYRMSVMSLVAEYGPDVDRERCIKMALVHDIAEAIVGDITPSDGVPKEEKSRREREAINHMCNLLGGGSRAKEILELWTEYEDNSSPEAKVVKDFDKVEMILQALEYEQAWRFFFARFCTGGVLLFSSDSRSTGKEAVFDFSWAQEQGMNLDEFFQSTEGKFQTDVGKAWALEISSRRRKPE